MKQPTKFQRWFLGLFGGAPKSDYDKVKYKPSNQTVTATLLLAEVEDV